jgi:hypothetical protein
MRKIALSLAVLAANLLPALYSAPARAQNFHSWISHSGNATSNCVLIAPCSSFNRALSQTRNTGQIGCLDSGSFGQMNITISVIIDCAGAVVAPDSDQGAVCASAIVINAPGRFVTLRGLHIAGSDPCQNNGIEIQAATGVFIEDCVIEYWVNNGILDKRTTGQTTLVVRNTMLRFNGSSGIVAAGAPRNSVVLENVQSIGNDGFGIAVATGNNVVISRSVMSRNGVAGIEADPGATLVVENTKISHNASYGIVAAGTITLANSDISFNNSSISGSTSSYGNNRIFDNGPGDAPTLISQQ